MHKLFVNKNHPSLSCLVSRYVCKVSYVLLMLLSYRQPEKDIEFVNIMLSEFPEFGKK